MLWANHSCSDDHAFWMGVTIYGRISGCIPYRYDQSHVCVWAHLP